MIVLCQLCFVSIKQNKPHLNTKNNLKWTKRVFILSLDLWVHSYPGLNNGLYNLFSIGTRPKSVIPSIMGNRHAFFVPGLGVFIIKMGKEAKDKNVEQGSLVPNS